MTDYNDQWTMTSITRGRLNGLKLYAKRNNRNPGQQLESILQQSGIHKISDDELDKAIAKIKGVKRK